MNGGSWRDYALVADSEPPRIVCTSPAIGFLAIADPPLAQACRQFLVEQGAQTFGSFTREEEDDEDEKIVNVN